VVLTSIWPAVERSDARRRPKPMKRSGDAFPPLRVSPSPTTSAHLGPSSPKATKTEDVVTSFALGSLLAIRSNWIESHAVTREPKVARDDPDHAERHAKQ